jgi:hypothetical protein
MPLQGAFRAFEAQGYKDFAPNGAEALSPALTYDFQASLISSKLTVGVIASLCRFRMCATKMERA